MENIVLPKGFVYLKDPRMLYIMSYASPANFVGQVVDGYHEKICIISEPAAVALIAVQDALDKLQKDYRLKIFDTYRPTSAVDHFSRWAADANDQKMKAEYYPDLNKADLFELKYIAEKSSHSRGSTVDLTITVEKDPKSKAPDQELDMGTAFDFFDDRSHTANPTISAVAKANRALLKDLMEAQGFENYKLEWWHYTLKNEPFPDTYFNFDVKQY
jgi:zinc D-Ala-D-Ala dipeptidase